MSEDQQREKISFSNTPPECPNCHESMKVFTNETPNIIKPRKWICPRCGEFKTTKICSECLNPLVCNMRKREKAAPTEFNDYYCDNYKCINCNKVVNLE